MVSLVYLQSRAPISIIHATALPSPQKEMLYLLAATLHPSLPHVLLLPVSIVLPAWTFHISGII